MKKVLILLTLLSFVIAAPFAVAQEKAKKDSPKINCCVKGDCKQMTEDKCTKAKGKVLAQCADCKVNCCIKGECKEMVKAECKKSKGKVVPDCDKCKPPQTSKRK